MRGSSQKEEKKKKGNKMNINYLNIKSDIYFSGTLNTNPVFFVHPVVLLRTKRKEIN
jgi:hypothetical protein